MLQIGLAVLQFTSTYEKLRIRELLMTGISRDTHNRIDRLDGRFAERELFL